MARDLRLPSWRDRLPWRFLKGGPMELHEILKSLCSIKDPSGAVVTLALDVAMPKPPLSEAGGFYRNRLLDQLGLNDHPAPTREILGSVSGRISHYLDMELRPETEGLFVVAGPGVWQPFELAVPVQDFMHVGRTPYLAPLLEALTRMPRAYVLRFDQQEGILEEVLMGTRKEIERLSSAVVERHAQHQMSSHTTLQAGSARSATRMGGGGRDRFQHCVEDAVEAMLHKAADKVLALQREAPSEAIYVFGDRKHFPFFRDRLPAGLRSQAIHVGPVPHRHEELLDQSIREQQASRLRNRIDGEILEFQARRAEQCHVASGPEEILRHLDTGKVARVFLDPGEPLPGTQCTACGARAGTDKEKCEACGSFLAATSMTQEVLSHVLLHPPVPLTFVPRGESWLEESGGMAALLSEKGIHSRR